MPARTKRKEHGTGGTERAQPVLLSPKLTRAVHLIATTEQPQKAVAKIVGMSESYLCKQLQRPEVAERLEQAKQAFAFDFEQLRNRARSLAITTAMDMLANSNNDNVKLKLVELLTREAAKGPGVVVNNTFGGGGYEYLPPNAQVIDIVGRDVTPTDRQSDGQEDETPTQQGD